MDFLRIKKIKQRITLFMMSWGSRRSSALYAVYCVATTLFSCLSELEYKNNHYLYECRFHLAKYKGRRALDTLKEADQSDLLERLYAGLLACGQLRFRETDLSTIALCSTEMSAIILGIQAVLVHMQGKNNQTSLQNALRQLNRAISQLEDHYYAILQVAAKKSMIYLIFIQELKIIDSIFRELLPKEVSETDAI